MDFTYLQAIARIKRKRFEGIAFGLWGASRILLVVSSVCVSTPIFAAYVFTYLSLELLTMIGLELSYLVPLEVFLRDRMEKKDYDSLFRKVQDFSLCQKRPLLYVLKKLISFSSSFYAFLMLGWAWQGIAYLILFIAIQLRDSKDREILPTVCEDLLKDFEHVDF